MKLKLIENILPKILAILIVFSTLFSLMPQQAFALDGFGPVNGGAAAGGISKPGNPNNFNTTSGVWTANKQGYRITVLDHSGAPAFTFDGKDSIDILFTSENNLDKMNFYVDGAKSDNGKGSIRVSKNAMNTKVYTFDALQYIFQKGIWGTITPSGTNTQEGINEKDRAISKLAHMPYPFTLEVGSTNEKGEVTSWRVQSYNGEVRKRLYGTSERLEYDAGLYALLNTYKLDNGKANWLWRPKSSAFFTTGGWTAEELASLNINIGEVENGIEGKTPIQLMAQRKLFISVEPIIWNPLRISANQWSYGVYGTQTGVARAIDWLADGSYFVQKNSAYGGYDSIIFGRGGSQAITLPSNMIAQFPGFNFADIGPKVYPWIMMPPTKAQFDKATNEERGAVNIGLGIHLYLVDTGVSEPSTHTWDAPIDMPAEAPDPSGIPLLKDEDPLKTRTINIVKTYRTREEGDVLTHISTHKRTQNPATILIEDEPEFVVKEWFISKVYNNPDLETTWEENQLQAPVTGDKGTAPTTVKVKDPNTTLYVLLENESVVAGAEDNASGSIVIKESQVTKSVETIDKSIVNWGPKTMQFSAADISGSCPEIVYCGDDDCGGHPCGEPYLLNDTSWSYNHRNTADIDKYIHANIGSFIPINDRGSDATGSRDTVSTYTNGVNSFNYKAVVWRGKDIPTMASYKEQSSHELKALVSRYGNTPQGKRYEGNLYTHSLKIELDKDGGNGDYTTTSITDHGYTKSANHVSANTLHYDATVSVEVYWGNQHKRGDETSKELLNLQTSLVGKPSSPKYSGGRMIQDSRPINFYPYIRMTYQVPGQKDPSRTNVNILSQWLSEMQPNDYVEAAWVSTADFNLNLKSSQWSLHNKAIAGNKGWDYSNRVLPGGAIYTLDTKDNKTWVSVVTWQPYLEEEVRTKVVTKGSEYTYDSTKAPHDNLVSEATKALENWRVVQYVTNYNQADGKTPDILDKSNSTMALDGLKVSGGGESLSSLGLLGKSSVDDKYYMKPASSDEAANEGDIDILSTQTIEIKYKVTADVEGRIHVYRDRDNSGWMEIFTLQKNQGPEALSGEAMSLDQRTKVITNLCTVLTRNTGNDTTASWAQSDGHWYNEAFDGICYTRCETSFEVGFKTPPMRSAALDPALCPINLGQSDLFSKAFISQFFMNDKSDAYKTEADGFIGKFKGTDVILAGYKELFKSMPFAIPNVNVQDIH